MVRKRAPGGGRKPQGEFTGKAAVFTTRITPEVRSALQREAERSGRSLSQEVEFRLRDSLDLPKELQMAWGKPPHRSIARIATMLSQRVGDWRRDPFAFETFRLALDMFLVHLAPAGWSRSGPFETPGDIEAVAAKLDHHFSKEQGDFSRRPEGQASAYVNGLLYQLESYNVLPLDKPANVHYAEEFYRMPRLREELGLSKQKSD